MRTIAIFIGVVAIYVVAGKLGLALALVHPSATAVWPPSGIALAAFVLLGYRIWPAILLGAFVVNVTTAGSVATSIGIASGNMAEGLVGAYLIKRFAGAPRCFQRPPDVLKFALLAALVATTVSATCGVTSLSLGGYANWSDFGSIWLTWWLGDAAGALIVAPLAILWAASSDTVWTRARLLEASALLASVVLAGLSAFGGLHPFTDKTYPIEFFTAPALVWAALRFGPRETATTIFALSGIAIWGTVHGMGPFAKQGPSEALLLLQSFMGVTAVTMSVLAAAVVERTRAEEHAARMREEAVRARAEAAIREREAFLSVAAHELRTPITSLRLQVQSLARELSRGRAPGQGRLLRGLTTIDEQSGKLAGLISRLLDVSRVESGKLLLEREPTNVAMLVGRLVQRMQAETEDHRIEVELPDDALALVDAVRLEEVVANLLDNALKYSPDGTPVEVRVSEPRSGEVEISIRDYGDGIAPEHRAHVFERYYQGEVRDYSPGLGLGLYISREIVRAHGGRLVAEFPPGGGSRFTAHLPCELSQPQEPLERREASCNVA